MSDIGLVLDGSTMTADLDVESNDLQRDDGLYTAIALSLFVDGRADPGDDLPAGDTDLRGWWGDAVPPVPGDIIGSRLWIVTRGKATAATLERAKRYSELALAWLIDDGVASAVNVEAEYQSGGMLAIRVIVSRPDVDPVTYQYDLVWSAIAGG